MYVDLHIHSIFSDSSRSPEEIVAIAKKRQVSLLSICDHSSISAYPRFIEACNKSNIKYTVGVELGGTMYGEDYHILAYNFDINDEGMLKFIQDEKNRSDKECEDMIVRMSKDYPNISIDDYINYECPKEKGGWKYIYYALEKNIFKFYEEAGEYIYSNYFVEDKGEKSVEELCNIVKRAGGVPVLAHPGYIYERNPEKFVSFLQDMYDRGIEGIECYYPSHNKETTLLCLDFCKKNNLRITAGSDCHGKYDTATNFTIGSLKITPDMLNLQGII